MRRIESHARAGRVARTWLSAFLLSAILSTTGCITIDVLGGGEEAALVETVVRGREGPKILLLDIDGVIGEVDLAGSFFGGPMLGTAARVAEVLDHARQDDEIAAVLLRIDSPGGTATESEQVYEEILRYREERRVPVVAQFLGTATSGAYYVAMAADRIQAHPTTVTGSIGVIFTSLSFAGLMEKLGVEDQTITGGEFKDAGSPFRRLTTSERAQLQGIVDDLHARFREIVRRGRPKLTAEQVEGLASGRIFSARQALEQGLVDGIGNLDGAVRALEARIGGAPTRVVTYHRPREIRRNLYTRSGAVPRIDGRAGFGSETAELLALQRLDRLFGEPGFHYVWWPGVSRPGLSFSGGLSGTSSESLSGSSSSERPFTNIAD